MFVVQNTSSAERGRIRCGRPAVIVALRRGRWALLIGLVGLLMIGALDPASAQSFGSGPTASEPFELRDGDRVVFLGNGFFERAQQFGYLEMALTTRWPDRDVVFRNLGWSGDTVYGDARGHFTEPPSAYDHLLDQVRTLEPTMIFVAYGMNAEPGEEPSFREGLNRLLDDLQETGARIVLLSPAMHEADRSPVPRAQATSENERLRRIAGIVEEVARTRELRFANLHDPLLRLARETDVPLTTNGIHLNATGYFAAATFLERGLGLGASQWHVRVSATGRIDRADGAEISDLRRAGGGVRFELRSERLPLPAPAGATDEFLARLGHERLLGISGLTPGTYRLRIDGNPVVSASAAAWTDGLAIRGGPEVARARRLREAIRRKNRLYFFRYRPQNETYLVGFREYEQGQNADELHQFETLIDERELTIGQLRTPGEAHVYRLELLDD